MWLIIGLGNPGRDYSKTRHNLGHMVVDALSSRTSISVKNKAKNFIYGTGTIAGEDTVLVKPLTYMNNSGLAVRDSMKKFIQAGSNIIIIHDDLDLDKGVIRIRKTGSAGGHRGVESIINITGTRDFLRLKIGIGRPEKIPAETYVLRPFPRRESSLIKKVIERSADAVEVIVERGAASAQNEFHGE
jgi:PTH1 family peptidyl-tRNA hydrolase